MHIGVRVTGGWRFKNMPDSARHGDKFSKPPILLGYTYDPEDAYRARDESRLLAIRLETNRSCNLRCRYCYAESGTGLANELGYEALLDLIRQAKELGVHSVVVIGGGEPTIYHRFEDLISFIHSLGIIPMIFSNTVAITEELAGFLYANNVSVMGKLDTFRPELQDYLAGRLGAYARIRRGLKNLFEAGFARTDDPHRLRLGLSFVASKLNLGEIEEVWHFCRQNNIFPNIEVLTPTGRAKANLPGQSPALEEIKDYKLRLLEIDRNDYSYDWLPYTPLPGSGCLQYLYSLYVTIDGNVRPCAPTKFDENPALRENGSYPQCVRKRSLKDIYDAPLFQYVRNIDRYLEGKCRACEHLSQCIGCRGYAYSAGTNDGKDPYSALRSECLHCFK
jgi:radical SAM protein with 4Fe4S-binding SPASM domain